MYENIFAQILSIRNTLEEITELDLKSEKQECILPDSKMRRI